MVKLNDFALVDLILGLEKDDGHSMYYYKALRPQMQEKLAFYLKGRGNLLVSGAYLAADMRSNMEQQWLAQYLKIQSGGSNTNNYDSVVTGLGTNFDVYRNLNEEHYGAHSPDIILPTGSAFSIMKYADNSSAAVAYKGYDYRSVVMGFPFECIKANNDRRRIMHGLISFLLQ